MKNDEVPQDDANMLQDKFKKLYYTAVGSVGWEMENVVLEQALEDNIFCRLHQRAKEKL